MTSLEPPSQPPPVLFTRTFDDPDQQLGPASIEDGRLVVRAQEPALPVGQPFDPRSLRDVVIEASMQLLEGAPGTTFGMYFRQSSEQRYVLWTVTGERRFRVGLLDGAYQPVHDGMLADDIPLHADAPNRLTAVTFGPSLTFVCNGRIVTGAMVDARYAEGPAGAWLQPGDDTGAALALDWVQVRAVLA
ncbi:MAG: hypothetical protein KY469_20300 [Actinobacteria bacterium]|nr:hypothetical protein [Actinomycetota bacterium]